jgi:hypothetical protein
VRATATKINVWCRQFANDCGGESEPERTPTEPGASPGPGDPIGQRPLCSWLPNYSRNLFGPLTCGLPRS